ncbi:MAG: HD-GYP domain-containing protein [Candidatus Kapaibacterium sp.]|jgi:response regulator RpfG family c-di-GMP phosphodiesterase|nr:HD domain-containing protein [Candidatus Kapabacteria bacterium]
MDNNELLTELQERLDLVSTKYARSFLQTVDMLVEVVTMFDRYHENSHVAFVGEKSAAVARALMLTEREVFEIETAGYLHDIGKFSLPPQFLSQLSSELNSFDFKHYASHVETGQRVLSMHEGMLSIAHIVGQHHERYDGMGFPAKKREHDIHIGARIIAVTNFYHNIMYKMRGSRHEAYSTPPPQMQQEAITVKHAQTMTLVNKRAGSMFDPKIVAAFNAVMENERRQFAGKSFMRVMINQLKPGMRLAEDLRTSFGLLIASQGDLITASTIPKLIRFAENKEISMKILVVV